MEHLLRHAFLHSYSEAISAISSANLKERTFCGRTEAVLSTEVDVPDMSPSLACLFLVLSLPCLHMPSPTTRKAGFDRSVADAVICSSKKVSVTMESEAILESIAGGRASAAKASTDGVWASRPMTSAATRMRFVTSAIWAAMCESLTLFSACASLAFSSNWGCNLESRSTQSKSLPLCCVMVRRNFASWRLLACAWLCKTSKVSGNVVHRQPATCGPFARTKSTEVKSVPGNPSTSISIVYKWYMVLMPLKDGDSSMSKCFPRNLTEFTSTSLAIKSSGFGSCCGSMWKCTSER
mmetsp:Transcript_964/g.2430  ORF Transcript_964/g.2430 Transcript_964/m.2430 type:complete len:295 (-) Transcript_964:718-1602(-)